MIRPIFNNKINNKAETNFKGTCIVNIPKKAFSVPDDADKCHDEFCIQLDEEVYKKSSCFENILMRFSKRPCKYLSKLIGEEYYDLKSKSPYSTDWLELHTGIELEKPLHKDFHSFYVFTKEEKDKIINAFNFRNRLRQQIKLNALTVKAEAEGRSMDLLTELANRYKMTEETIDEIIDNKIDAQILLKDLSKQEIKQLYDLLKDYGLI